jgi:hypothetical protein
MAPRVAALLVLLCATAASAAVTCPTTAAATSCYAGMVSASWPASGGTCTCKCGVSVATADYSYENSAGDLTTMVTVAPSSTGCTSAFCGATYATECGSAAYTSATYESYASMAAAPAPSTSDSGICVVTTYACSTAAPCMPGMTSGSLTTYTSIDTVADCSVALVLGATFTVACGTTNCNSPSSTSAAAPSKPAMALAAVGAAAVAACL